MEVSPWMTEQGECFPAELGVGTVALTLAAALPRVVPSRGWLGLPDAWGRLLGWDTGGSEAVGRAHGRRGVREGMDGLACANAWYRTVPWPDSRNEWGGGSLVVVGAHMSVPGGCCIQSVRASGELKLVMIVVCENDAWLKDGRTDGAVRNTRAEHARCPRIVAAGRAACPLALATARRENPLGTGRVAGARGGKSHTIRRRRGTQRAMSSKVRARCECDDSRLGPRNHGMPATTGKCE